MSDFVRTWINSKKKRMNRLFDLNKRDKNGLVCWFAAGFWLNLLDKCINGNTITLKGLNGRT